MLIIEVDKVRWNMLKSLLKNIRRKVFADVKQQLDELQRINKELLWRDIFIDTIKGYKWTESAGGAIAVSWPLGNRL